MCVCVCVDYVVYICEKMGDNWRSNSVPNLEPFLGRPPLLRRTKRKTQRTHTKRERERNNGKTPQEDDEDDEDDDDDEEGVLRRMDPAATLVVLLVVLVFGFLFGNIAL